MGEVTELIVAARGGDRDAGDRLFAAVYADLHRIAERQVGRNAADGMRATSLVHEAYFRLARPDALQLNDREHFFAVAARAMRQLVVDHARHRAAVKRGSGQAAATLDDAQPDSGSGGRDDDVLALDQALAHLTDVDPALTQLVEMRFFAGLDLAEIADVTGRSERSLKRDWRRARAFLHVQLGGDATLLPGEAEGRA
jgi:RNA polymerase sigma factor (TIGR02999 family)